MKPYKPWDFCKSIDCDALSVVHKDERMKKVYCHKCYAYQFHQYLRDHDQILEEGSSLARVIQATIGRSRRRHKMKDNTPIQSYFRSQQERPRPARSYHTRQFPRWLAGLLFIIFLILLLSLGGVAEILFGLQEPGPDSPSISYASSNYFIHPNHEFIPVSRHQEVMTFEATAYTLADGNGDGLTATMVRPQVGRTIAVDPAIIPYGSKVIVDGHTYVAEDTGGDIRGNRIDIYFGEGPEAYERAMEWGRRPVKMIVLPREE